MKLFFAEQGSGYPVVLLHGFPFDHHAWDPLRTHLADGSRFIIPDLRGFGSSQVKRSDYRLSVMADDVVALLDTLEIKRAALIGHSMGGYVALEIASQVLERIDGIGLIASHIYSDSLDQRINRYAQIEQLRTETPGDVFSGMPAKLAQDKSVRDYCRKAILKTDRVGAQGALNAMANRPSAETLWREMGIPQLVLAGRQDQFVTTEISDQVVRTGKNVKYTVLENAGHMLIREKPAIVAKELERFIRMIRRE